MNSFAKNVAIMSVAPIVTQALSFLITPVISRLYTPEQYGLAALFGSFVMPFAIFANMGYSSAIVVPEKEEDATNLFTVSLLFTFIVSVLSLSLIFLKGSFVLSWFHAEKIGSYLWLLPLSVLFHGMYMSFRYLNIRKKRFGHISTAKIFRFLSANGTYLIAGFTGFASGFFLILGDFLGGVSATTILNRSLWKNYKKEFLSNVSFKSIKVVAKKFSKYPKFILLTDLISRFSGQIPIYLFSFYFSAAIVGFYALGLRLLTIPINFLGSSIGEVFFQEASSNKSEIPATLEKLFKYLVILGLPVFCYLGIIGHEIFYTIFGENWSEAGIFVQILSFYMFVKFITIPASYLMLIYEKQEFSVYLNIATLTVSTISLVIGGAIGNVYMALGLFSLTNAIVYLIYGLGFMNFAGLRYSKTFKIISKMLLITSFFAIILIAIKLFLSQSFMVIIILSSIILIGFYLILLTRSPESKRMLVLITGKVKSKMKRK